MYKSQNNEGRGNHRESIRKQLTVVQAEKTASIPSRYKYR